MTSVCKMDYWLLVLNRFKVIFTGLQEGNITIIDSDNLGAVDNTFDG